MPLHLSLCCILHAMVHFMGAFVVLVCWILVPGKNFLRLCFGPLVLICGMHPSKCGESFCFFCIMLLCLDVLRCNLEIKLSVLRFPFSALSILPPGSLVPSTLWGLWIHHNIRVFLQFSEFFSDYFHPIM